ncbi:peptidyl-lys metalloendopeptidase [Rhizoctonia solani 123E]|uniref:Peptidyl-lys metalloendopeptidase n=1 Tax=Rhizoctonia solani 123E TaxID=1423351 RepID=A0A074RWU9_9AGAM|nr:peptidyl-lys metalloendopeptidase [Rhizoctonia solani 123E]
MRELSLATATRPISSLSKSSTFRKRNLLFESCTDDQQSSITGAATLANAMVEHANKELNAPTVKKVHSRYQTWFGHYDQLRHHIVKKHFLSLSGQATTFTYDCGTCPSKFGSSNAWMYAYAQTHPDTAKEMYLCEGFWKRPRHNADSKPALLVNALSRFPEYGGTTDYYITPTEVEKLAAHNPEGAIQNAENYKRL